MKKFFIVYQVSMTKGGVIFPGWRWYGVRSCSPIYELFFSLLRCLAYLSPLRDAVYTNSYPIESYSMLWLLLEAVCLLIVLLWLQYCPLKDIALLVQWCVSLNNWQVIGLFVFVWLFILFCPFVIVPRSELNPVTKKSKWFESMSHLYENKNRQT